MSNCIPVPTGDYIFPTVSSGATFAPITQTLTAPNGEVYTIPVYGPGGGITYSTTECQFEDVFDEHYYVNVVAIDPAPRSFTFTESDPTGGLSPIIDPETGLPIPLVLTSTATLTPNSAVINFNPVLARPEDSALYSASTYSNSLFINCSATNLRDCIAVGGLFNGYEVTKVVHFVTAGNFLDSTKIHYIEIDTTTSTAVFNSVTIYENNWTVAAGWTIKALAGVMGVYISTIKTIGYSPYFGGKIRKNNTTNEAVFTNANYTLTQTTEGDLSITEIGSANQTVATLLAANESTNAILNASNSIGANFSDFNQTKITTSRLSSTITSSPSSPDYDNITYRLNDFSYDAEIGSNPFGPIARKRVSYDIVFGFTVTVPTGVPLVYGYNLKGDVITVNGSLGADFIAPDLSYQSVYDKYFIFRLQDSTQMFSTLFNSSVANSTLTESLAANNFEMSLKSTQNFLSSGFVNVTAYSHIEDSTKYIYLGTQIFYYNSIDYVNNKLLEIVRDTSIPIDYSNYQVSETNSIYFVVSQTKSWLYNFNT